MRQRTPREWMLMLLVAIVVCAAFLAPAAVIRQSHDNTEQIIDRIERNAKDRLEDAISVNILTITCMLAIEPENRTQESLRMCIEEGFEESPIEPPEPPDVP